MKILKFIYLILFFSFRKIGRFRHRPFLGIKSKKDPWLLEERKLLWKHRDVGIRMLCFLFKRTKLQIKTQLGKVGVTKKGNFWTRDEDDFLRKHWRTTKYNHKWVIEKLGRSLSAVYSRAEILGLTRLLLVRKPVPPLKIDREFGYYFSGLTEGEGSFSVSLDPKKKVCNVKFAIGMSMEKELINEIRSKLGFGSVYKVREKKSKTLPYSYRFHVGSLAECKTIVNLFEQYPFHGRKKREFKIWKKIIELMWTREKQEYNFITWQKITYLAGQLNKNTRQGSNRRKYNLSYLAPLYFISKKSRMQKFAKPLPSTK